MNHIPTWQVQKNFFLLTILTLFVLFADCSPEHVEISKPPMWGDLHTGAYDVGFKTIFTYDLARPAVPYSDWDGKLYTFDQAEGRQMQINVWYPANPSAKSKRLYFDHYLNLLARQTDFGPIDQQKEDFAAQQYIAKTNALGGNGSFTAQKLDSLNNLETFATLEARPAEGSFPLLVFPNGGSPAFQSIMCEYLASHGFVVGAMAAKGQDAFTDEASFRSIETAVTDLEFALRKLLEIPQVNREKIAMIGNAITSSQIVAYQSRNSNIDAIISLEGGLLSSFEQNILKKTAYYTPEAVDVPILAIYAPHPAIDPEYIFHLKYAERYFVHFPQMTEFHFLNYGPFDRFVPNIIGEHEGGVQKGYEWACQYVLRFLEAYLSEDQSSLSFLLEGPPAEAVEHIDTFFIKNALAKPPNITYLKDAFTKEGFTFIDSVYQAHRATDSMPLSKQFYADFKDWLAWQKDPTYENRYQLYKLAYDSYPESALVNYYLTYYALQTDRKEESRFHNRKALSLLDTDNDPELTSERKITIKNNLEEFAQ